jgi:hypothetical protein
MSSRSVVTAGADKYILMTYNSETYLVLRPTSRQAAEATARAQFKHMTANEKLDISLRWKGHVGKMAKDLDFADVVKVVDELVMSRSYVCIISSHTPQMLMVSLGSMLSVLGAAGVISRQENDVLICRTHAHASLLYWPFRIA